MTTELEFDAKNSDIVKCPWCDDYCQYHEFDDDTKQHRVGSICDAASKAGEEADAVDAGAMGNDWGRGSFQDTLPHAIEDYNARVEAGRATNQHDAW